MRIEIIFVLLFSIATAVALIARRLRVPYTVALVLAGVILGAFHVVSPPHLTKDLLYALFLPGLVFEAAFHLESKELWANKVVVGSLAFPGVLVGIGLVAILVVPGARALNLLDGFGWTDGVILGTLLAATDPIAVVALFRSLGAPRRLGVLVEGESLLNDGTAVVFFTLVIEAVRGNLSIGGAALDFVRVVGIGAVVGVAVGYAVSRVIRRVDDAMIEITLTTIAAYGSFALAESAHVSGIIATVAAGMICGGYGARSMSPRTRLATLSFWDYVAFALNSVVFLLIGFEVRIRELIASWDAILLAWGGVMVARTLVVALTWVFVRRTRERLPISWIPMMTWGGVRGALAMVLALALPDDLPMRPILLRMTFGVVLLSILVQGLTAGGLLRRLGIAERRDSGPDEARRAEVFAAQAALGELNRLRQEGGATGDVVEELGAEYRRRLASAEGDPRTPGEDERRHHAEELRRTRRQVLLAQKDALLRALRQDLLGNEAVEAQLHAVDRALAEDA